MSPVPRASSPLWASLGVVLVLAGCGGDGAANSLARGDRLAAQGEDEAAVAEYRLARRQQGDDPEVLARLAHAHAAAGDVSAAARLYGELVGRDSSYRYQAASDLTALARRELDRHGRDRMVRALEPVLDLGLDLVPTDLGLELARHYSDRQDFRRALPLYLSVLEGDLEAGSRVYYGAARAYQELGGCREALPYFREYLDRAEADREADSEGGGRWHYGSCLHDVAREDWEHGRRGDALERVDTLIDMGTPRTLMDRAHYLRGEMLLESGRDDEALEAYREVLRLNPDRSDPLARSAEERVREIRYGAPE
ncbi:MAG: tetratricopeptide repeat protein [Gemmatimonadota bacterium]